MRFLVFICTIVVTHAAIEKLSIFFHAIKKIGVEDTMSGFKKRKLGVFNLFNFFGIITGIILFFAVSGSKSYIPLIGLIVATSPFFISLIAIILNSYHKYNYALAWYLIMYPIDTSILYHNNIDAGLQLFFILFAVLAAFFLESLVRTYVSVLYSMLCYFVAFSIHPQYDFVLKNVDFSIYVLVQAIAIINMFIGLILIKKENTSYQTEIEIANNELKQINKEILYQRKELAEKTRTLEEQADKLKELDTVKTRLFSVISHDLKSWFLLIGCY